MDCIFCKIVKGEVPCHKIYEDDKTLAFLDIADDFEGHTLVIPKKHVKNLNDCSNCQITNAIKVAKMISDHYLTLGYDGVNLRINSGKAAGQEVEHLHIHIIPRRNGDNVKPCHKCASQGRDLAALAKQLRIK